MCLVGVTSIATFGVASAAGSAAFWWWWWYFIGNNLFLKVLRTFSPALNNNPILLKKAYFQVSFIPFSKFFNSKSKLLCLRSTFSNDKYPSFISLKKL